MATSMTKKVTRFSGLCAKSEGYWAGTTGNETPLGTPYIITFGSASTAQTVYCISPVTGNVVAGYVCCDTSARTTTYTAQLGSAGTTLCAATQASGVAGLVSSFTMGTVAITAGASFSVTRAAMGSTGSSVVVLNILQTA